MLQRLRDSVGAAAADRLPDEVAARVPEDAVDRVPAAVREEVRARRADRDFRERALPDREPAADAPDHVVCVVVDALRADAVDPAVTPFLAGARGTTAVTPSTWTFPAVSSLLTGRYPHDHGATRRSDSFADSVADMTPLPPRMDDGVATLPELLAGAGYETYGAFGMIVPFLALSGRFGRHRLDGEADAPALFDAHEDWLADRRGDRTFSYLHLDDLHEPVDPPARYWEAHGVADLPGVRTWRHEAVVGDSPAVERYREHRRRLYRAAAEYVDNALETHARRLSDLLGGDLLLVVVGDHGEAFWERAAFAAERFADPRPAYCVGHGGAPYEAVTRVPLRLVGGERHLDAPTVEGPTSLVDVAPTVLDAVGLDPPRETAGRSLADEPPAERPLLVESARYGYEKRAVYRGGWKLLASRGDGVEAFFELRADADDAARAAETAEPPDDVARALRDALPAWLGEDGSDGRAGGDVDDAVERRLADLGYR